MSHPPVVASILKSRGAVLELVVAAVVLALGVNLLATAIADLFETSKQAMLWTSLALVVASLAIIARRTIASRYVSRSFEAFLCYHSKENRLVEVPRYAFSEHISDYFKGLFAENEAPKKLWDSDPLSNTFKFDTKTGSFEKRTTAAGQLIVEAVEYLLLEKLSTHLTDYFNHASLDKEGLQELTREDVPSVIFKNRFLDTFSRPMQERAAFVEATLKRGGATIGKISSSYGPGGLRYAEFDLVLPANAKVQRVAPNSVEIDTSKFCVKLEVTFSGFNTNLPRGFERLYLDGMSLGDVQTYSVDIKAIVQFKPLALLSQTGWQYHSWLDSFLTSLEEAVSKEEFFQRIDWYRAMTVARVVQRTLSSVGKKSGPAGSET
jgi:hypothetical protein